MRPLFLILIIIISIISCSTEEDSRPDIEVGSGFIESETRLIRIDTFQVDLATFKFDSINSSETNRALVGKYNDSALGTVRSSTYMQLTSQTYEIPDDAELDSVALILGYDTYSYNDTLQLNQIRVHLITEKFEPDEDVFYNTSTLDYDPTPMAVRNYRPEPHKEDSIHISITTPFTVNLFELIKEGDIDNFLELTQNFRGFSLQPGEMDDGSVIGFSQNPDQTYLRFFYSIPEEIDDEEGTFDLSLNPATNSINLFNNIISDVSNNPLGPLIDQEIELASTDNNLKTYIHSGVGYATKIKFPSIEKIKELDGEGVILNAQLRLRPVGFDEKLHIADTLNISVVDANNVITEPQLFNGSGIIIVRLREENIEFNELFYEVSVGTYLNRKINEDQTIDDALVIYHTNFNRQVGRIVIDQSENAPFETQLIVNYAIYEN